MTSDEQPITQDQKYRSRVYDFLDSTGGSMTALHNALDAADEAGLHVETEKSLAADADNLLQRATNDMHEGNANPDEVYETIDNACDFTSRLRRGMCDTVRDFEIPDHVDAGAYDTLGSYLVYIDRDLHILREYADYWSEAEKYKL